MSQTSWTLPAWTHSLQVQAGASTPVLLLLLSVVGMVPAAAAVV
jgi:hypothetical protein